MYAELSSMSDLSLLDAQQIQETNRANPAV
jgi:hypothetical protein